MKDKAVQGLSDAKRKNTLENDANVAERNKKGVGKRDNGSSISSGGSLKNSPSLSVNQKNQSLINNISNQTEKNQEAKSRLQKRQQMQNQAIKMAEKIPVASKYAKFAKLKEQVSMAKNKRRNPLLSFFNDNEKTTKSELEEANAANKKGEEYKPEDTELKYTAITNRQLKLFVIGLSGGAIFTIMFLAVIFISSITETGKEAYLASADNPTEDEFEKAYDANTKIDSDSSDSNDND